MTEQLSHQEVGGSIIVAQGEVGEITGGVPAEVGTAEEIIEADREAVVKVVNGIQVASHSLKKMILVLMMKMVILTWSQKSLKRDSKFGHIR